MKLITTGITRIVFLTSRYAIKVPRMNYGWRLFIEGIRSNLNERELWAISKVPDTPLTQIRPHLCPVVWSSWGAWIVVMRRADQMIDRFPDVLPSQMREVFLKLERHIGDHKGENYGLIGDQIVMLDYGSTYIDYRSDNKPATYK